MGDSIKKYRYDGSKKFNIDKFDTSETGEFDSRDEAVDEFVRNLDKINKKQQKLYAEGKEGLVIVFQAMDAAGKDGVIRTVFSTLTPHGVKEFCFKVPSTMELSHDYLWRFWSALPAKGNISIFNRSYYEDVLVGKVHKLYENQKFPDRIDKSHIIEDRYNQINEFERYLYDTGTRVIKVFLNVSKDEQALRFISRIDTPKKNWKISANDIKEREYWDDYMDAFEIMVNETSSKISPWYVVPSDHKWYSRLVVSRIVLQILEEMDPEYPVVGEDQKEEMETLRQTLVDSLSEEGKEKLENEEAYEDLGAFSKTEKLPAGMYKMEELYKAHMKEARIKDSGFQSIQDLLSKNIFLKSKNDIVTAIANAKFKKQENPIQNTETSPEEETISSPDESDN